MCRSPSSMSASNRSTSITGLPGRESSRMTVPIRFRISRMTFDSSVLASRPWTAVATRAPPKHTSMMVAWLSLNWVGWRGFISASHLSIPRRVDRRMTLGHPRAGRDLDRKAGQCRRSFGGPRLVGIVIRGVGRRADRALVPRRLVRRINPREGWVWLGRSRPCPRVGHGCRCRMRRAFGHRRRRPSWAAT